MNKTNLQPGNGYQLPPDAYYSEEWLEKENCHLFARTWNYACTTDDLPSAGSYVTVQVGHYSIALVRGDDNVIRGFHNVCRHRGAKILDDNGTCTKLRCPYHAWVYDLEGSLKSVPQGKQQIPLLDKTEWNLLSINVGIWMGMVFVNPDGKAEPFETFRGEISGVLDCFRLDELTELTKVEYIFDANWKFYIENHIDWYHLWYTHEHTLGALDHSAGYTKQINPHWVSFEPYKDKDTQTPPFKPIGGLTEEAKLNGAHLVFPNLTLFSGESWFGTGHITPVALSSRQDAG